MMCKKFSLKKTHIYPSQENSAFSDSASALKEQEITDQNPQSNIIANIPQLREAMESKNKHI